MARPSVSKMLVWEFTVASLRIISLTKIPYLSHQKLIKKKHFSSQLTASWLHEGQLNGRFGRTDKMSPFPRYRCLWPMWKTVSKLPLGVPYRLTSPPWEFLTACSLGIASRAKGADGRRKYVAAVRLFDVPDGKLQAHPPCHPLLGYFLCLRFIDTWQLEAT